MRFFNSLFALTLVLGAWWLYGPITEWLDMEYIPLNEGNDLLALFICVAPVLFMLLSNREEFWVPIFSLVMFVWFYTDLGEEGLYYIDSLAELNFIQWSCIFLSTVYLISTFYGLYLDIKKG